MQEAREDELLFLKAGVLEMTAVHRRSQVRSSRSIAAERSLNFLHQRCREVFHYRTAPGKIARIFAAMKPFPSVYALARSHAATRTL